MDWGLFFFADLRNFAVKFRLFLPFRVGETLSDETSFFLTYNPLFRCVSQHFPFSGFSKCRIIERKQLPRNSRQFI